jgi:hypothetical protein
MQLLATQDHEGEIMQMIRLRDLVSPIVRWKVVCDDANSRERNHGSGNEATHDRGRREKVQSWYPQGNNRGR